MNATVERLITRWIILIVLFLSFAAYSNSLSGEFVFDDVDQVVNNRDIRSWNNLTKAFSTHVWAFREKADANTPPPLPYYRPIFTVMITIEYHLFQLSWPQGWHLVSLLLHVLCSLLVFNVLSLVSGRAGVAAIAAALFAAHPIHSEPVSWISSIPDLLCGLFFLLSFYLYLKHGSGSAGGKQSALSAGRDRMILAGSVLMYLLAALSKETALVLPLLILGYEIARFRGSLRRSFIVSVVRSAPFFAATLLYLLLRYNALGDLMWKNPQAPDRPFVLTLLTLPGVIAMYLGRLIWPFGSSITYYTHFVTKVVSAEFLIPMTILALIVTPLVLYRKRVNWLIWFSLLLIFLPILPVLNLGQVSREEYLVFDRYLYISAAGWCFLIALGIDEALEWERNRWAARSGAVSNTGRAVVSPVLFALVILIALLTLATARENTHWATEYSLWSNAARVSPNFWAAHYNAGLALSRERRFQEAVDSLSRAARLGRPEASVLDALGVAYDGLADKANALLSFKHALEIDPAKFESLNNLGGLYYRSGDYPSAERLFKSALQVNSSAADARYNLGLCFAREGRYDESAREIESVIKARPDDAEAFFDLGLAYEKLGHSEAAARAFAQSVAIAKSDELKEKASEAIVRLRNSAH